MNEHLIYLNQCIQDTQSGYQSWNNWRTVNGIMNPQLEGIELSGITIQNYNFAGANLKGAKITDSIMLKCSFHQANLENIKINNSNCGFSDFSATTLVNSDLSHSQFTLGTFIRSNCENTNFSNSNLTNSIFGNSNLSHANFENTMLITANLANCNLQHSLFINSVLSGTNFSNSNLSNATIKDSIVFGISAWNITTTNLNQENLTITNHEDDHIFTVDDIELAQFIYLISNNEKIANAIDKLTSKVVLILGRFTPERMKILQGVKEILKKNGFIPVLFDFEGPKNRDFTETVGLIGRMSRFIVADLTDAKSIPQELSELIPNNPSIKIQPILLKGEREYSMFEHWTKYPWVQEIFSYDDVESLNGFFRDNTASLSEQL